MVTGAVGGASAARGGAFDVDGDIDVSDPNGVVSVFKPNPARLYHSRASKAAVTDAVLRSASVAMVVVSSGYLCSRAP